MNNANETKTMSKMNEATLMYLNAVAEGAKRADVIAAFMEVLGMSKPAASTYFQTIKSRAGQSAAQARKSKPATMSKGCLDLFAALINDAGNWNGNPPLNVNVETTKADRGYVTHLKKIGFIGTSWDDESRISWVHFLPAGIEYAISNELAGASDLHHYYKAAAEILGTVEG